MERGTAETMQSSHQPQNVNSCFIKIMCSQEAAAASLVGVNMRNIGGNIGEVSAVSGPMSRPLLCSPGMIFIVSKCTK